MVARPPPVGVLYRRWLARYVPAAALILLVSALVGFFLGSLVPVEALPQPSDSGQNPFLPAALTTTSIASNNLIAMFVMLLGAVSLGLATVLSLLINGLLIGAVVGIAVQQLSLLAVAALIVPHGIIEIPALLIAAAVGLRFGWQTIQYIRGRTTELVTVRDLREAGWLIAFAAVLIVIAAYIEANMTLELADRYTEVDLSELHVT